MIKITLEIPPDIAEQFRDALSDALDEATVATMPSPLLPPAAAAEPVPQPPIDEMKPLFTVFGAPDNDGVSWWPFLAELANTYGVPIPKGVIANFVLDNLTEDQKRVITEAQKRSVEMNVGGAALNHNIAYRIVESTGLWDRVRGNVKWRLGDVLQGVIAFSPNDTLDMAKQMLRGRVKRMELANSLRHFKWLDSNDYQAGA